MKETKFNFKVNDKEYQMIFNLNVMQEIQEEYGTVGAWGELTDGKSGEVNAKALIFGLTAMINEAIDMKNEETGSTDEFLGHKKVARLVSELGIQKATEQLNNAVVESTNSDEKN